MRAAVDFLQHGVPMNAADAREEVAEMGELTGQKISYRTEKLQIMQLLQDAQLNQCDRFSVETSLNYVRLNGNVPKGSAHSAFVGREIKIDR